MARMAIVNPRIHALRREEKSADVLIKYMTVNIPKEINFDTDVLSTGVGNGLGFDLFTGPSAKRFGGMIRLTF